MNLILGVLLLVIGFMQFAIARDRALWVSYAIESFRWCLSWGYTMLGARFIWIYLYGDEPGVSLWAQCALGTICIGNFGLQMNNLVSNTMHIPKFLRKAID